MHRSKLEWFGCLEESRDEGLAKGDWWKRTRGGWVGDTTTKMEGRGKRFVDGKGVTVREGREVEREQREMGMGGCMEIVRGGILPF